MAERPGNRAKRSNARMQRKAPQRAQRPAPTVQRRQVTRSPQRQQRRQVTRSPQRQQRQQVTRSPQRQQRQVTRSPQGQQRQQVTRSSQPRQQQRFTNSPRRQERQKMTRSPQRQERREMTRGPQRQERQKMTRGPQREERQKMTRSPQRQEGRKMTRGPQRQERQKVTRGPQRQERQTNRPQRGQGDRDQRLDNRGPNRGYANRNQRPGRNANGVSFTRPGRIDTRKTRPAQQVVRQPLATGARRGATANFNRNYNANVNQNYNYNQNVNVNRNVVVSQPATYTYAAPNVCPPAYSVVNNYNPYAYANYWDRRDYRRRYRNNCNWPLLILGFFISRPYSSYDYARVDYNNQPYFYGDDNAYQASPIAVGSEGGPVAATPNFDSKEEQMLVALSEHVQASSVDGAYQISDAAFNGQLWNLDLAQAPAVFEIQDGLYSVVAGFEGTLGAGEVPSNVNVEFFIAHTANGYEVRDAWITSANGIPRNRLYQSPVYPDVSTWEPGRLCPFTGREMVPMEAHTSEHG